MRAVSDSFAYAHICHQQINCVFAYEKPSSQRKLNRHNPTRIAINIFVVAADTLAAYFREWNCFVHPTVAGRIAENYRVNNVRSTDYIFIGYIQLNGNRSVRQKFVGVPIGNLWGVRLTIQIQFSALWEYSLTFRQEIGFPVLLRPPT